MENKNKKFCRKCQGKIFCVHKEPEMSPVEIQTLILTAILQNKSVGLQMLYKYMMPEYREKLGGFRGMEKYITQNFPGFLETEFVKIIDDFKEEDECSGYMEIEYKDARINRKIKIRMERAFDYIANKPLNDRYAKEKLALYWRIIGMDILNGKN